MNKRGQEKLKAEIEQNGYAIRYTKLPRKLKKRLKKEHNYPVLSIIHRNVAKVLKLEFEITKDKVELK